MEREIYHCATFMILFHTHSTYCGLSPCLSLTQRSLIRARSLAWSLHYRAPLWAPAPTRSTTRVVSIRAAYANESATEPATKFPSSQVSQMSSSYYLYEYSRWHGCLQFLTDLVPPHCAQHSPVFCSHGCQRYWLAPINFLDQLGGCRAHPSMSRVWSGASWSEVLFESRLRHRESQAIAVPQSHMLQP